MVKQMAENDYKINSGVISPPPPSIASDSEFTTGTSTTASPTVKQCKEKLATIDTDQTITGCKTFQTTNTRSEIYMNSNTTVVSGATTFAASIVQKINDTPIGYIESGIDSYNRYFAQIATNNKVNNVDSYACLGVWIDSNGFMRAYAPTSDVSDTGMEVITASCLNTKFQMVSALPANPNPNVFYFIPE